MENNYVVGNVISVDGLKIKILMNERSNLETFHFNGTPYEGISVGSYVGIIRGSNKIIARVEKEFLEDTEKDPKNIQFSRDRFKRQIEVSLIGNLCKNNFTFGIKRFPMIFNEVVLLTEKEISVILQKDSSQSKNWISIGQSVSHNIPIKISWDNLFNTHIGIFGNTGSGKSNTLTKLYTELFNTKKNNISNNFNNNSKFIIFDFNGEYLKKTVFNENKNCLEISSEEKINRIPLEKNVFWNIDTLSILYSATEKTQRPFLINALKQFKNKDESENNSQLEITSKKIEDKLCEAFKIIFQKNNHKETLELLKDSLAIIFDKFENTESSDWLKSSWNSASKTFYLVDELGNKTFFNNSKIIKNLKNEKDKLKNKLEELEEKIDELSETKKLKIILNIQLIFSLCYGQTNFEHISPLLRRIESKSTFIENTIEIVEKQELLKLINVISFKKCNTEDKKMLSLLIAKNLYDKQKKLSNENTISSTVHLIIDEAHNILSEQSNREESTWKDYRLEVFEEIIKEGRKFGFFLTISSQRPNDISPTIISQLHNYFIHRLVNENDLRMISNTINSLDSVSKNRIPQLSSGQCIITGTSFQMPLLVQVEQLNQRKRPSSDNVNLIELWTKKQK